ncbi:hypothetical protein IGB31_14210 [Pseudomonas putida]|nr:hypothetical protein IGB31_14210 [Pseudomonas putida]
MKRLERKLNKRLEKDKLILISKLLGISYNKDTNSLTEWSSDYSGLYMPEPIFEEFKSYMNPLVADIVTTDPTGLPANTAHSIQLIGSFSNYVVDVSKLLNAHTIHRMSAERDTLSTYQFILKHYKTINETIRRSSLNFNRQIYKLFAGDKDSSTQTYNEEELFKRIINLIHIEETRMSEERVVKQILKYDFELFEGENINRLCKLVGLEKITFIITDDDFFSCDKTDSNIIVTFSTKKKTYMIKTCSFHGQRTYEYKAENNEIKYRTDNNVLISEFTQLEIELSKYITDKTKYVEFFPTFKHFDNIICTANTKIREFLE